MNVFQKFTWLHQTGMETRCQQLELDVFAKILTTTSFIDLHQNEQNLFVYSYHISVQIHVRTWGLTVYRRVARPKLQHFVIFWREIIHYYHYDSRIIFSFVCSGLEVDSCNATDQSQIKASAYNDVFLDQKTLLRSTRSYLVDNIYEPSERVTIAEQLYNVSISNGRMLKFVRVFLWTGLACMHATHRVILNRNLIVDGTKNLMECRNLKYTKNEISAARQSRRRGRDNEATKKETHN